MTQTTSNRGKERFDKRFKEAQAYLKANGFNRSIINLMEDMERCEKNTKKLFIR